MGPPMQVPQTVAFEWLELAALVAIGVMLLAVTLSLAADGPSRIAGPRRTGGRGRTNRACRHFAEAVARGDLEAADRAASLALGAPRAGRHRDRDRAVIGWDERKLFVVPVEEIRRQFTDPAANEFWFPDVHRRPHGGHIDVFLGTSDPIRLTLESETWTPQDLSFTATHGDVRIAGHLSLRTVVTGATPEEIRAGVEVWIHMETTDTADGRRVLARALNATRDGLGRMAAELNPL